MTRDVEAERYRATLGDAELLLYAAVRSREPLRLPAAQAARLHRLLDAVGRERAGTAAAWRVDRSAYAAAV